MSGCCTLWWDSGTNSEESGASLIEMEFVPRSHHRSLQDGGKQSKIKITPISRPGWLVYEVSSRTEPIWWWSTSGMQLIFCAIGVHSQFVAWILPGSITRTRVCQYGMNCVSICHWINLSALETSLNIAVVYGC